MRFPTNTGSSHRSTGPLRRAAPHTATWRSFAATLVLALSSAHPAVAQRASPTGFFIGADVGRSTLDDYEFGNVGALMTRDGTDESFRLIGGYRFSKYFALETGYADLGRFSAEVEVPCLMIAGSDCDYDVDTSVDGAFINAVGTWPLSKGVYLSAMLGAFYYRSDTRTVLDLISAPARTSDSGIVAQFGFGAGFHINERFTITLDWLRNKDASIHTWPNSQSRYDAEFSTVTAGLRFSF